MSTNRYLNPRTGGSKADQIAEAKKTQKDVEELASRTGRDPPPYDFLEMIGKGSYGRVYKVKNRNTQQVAALKVIEVDSVDFKERSDSIKDFAKEITALHQLKDSKAKNINLIFEAFSVRSQLWIISEYCPGGSVRTLMRALKQPGLQEEYIIPIARELAVALKCVHDAGIIHRDVKCANILVTESGGVQLCDFGVSGMLESDIAKRSTIVGTPHWLAPEILSEMAHSDDFNVTNPYGTEVDCWAFGCAVYEMATGMPPYPQYNNPAQLSYAIKRKPPRLEGGDYSKGLRDLVAFCLEERPEDRPSAQGILQHPYLIDSAKKYPSEGLQELLEQYAMWEQQGGQRTSLFEPYGAARADALGDEQEDDWNFSTTLEFDMRVARRSMALLEQDFGSDSGDLITPKPGSRGGAIPLSDSENEKRVEYGEKRLMRLFDPNSTPYDSSRRRSDLPLRNEGTDKAADRTTMIDLDMADIGFGDVPNLDLSSVSTLKANRTNRFLKESDDDYEEDELTMQPNRRSKRATKDWKMPLFTAPPVPESNRRTQDWTFPKMDVPDLNLVEPSPPPPMPNGKGARSRVNRANTTDVNDTAANRRTRDWKFPVMEPSDPGHDRGASMPSPEMPRLPLKHSATMPVGNLDDNFSSSRSFGRDSPSRESIIDLDFANVNEIPRPSTSHSLTPSIAESIAESTATDVTSGDPFELEDHIRMAKSKSDHAAGPTPGGPTTNSGSNRQSFHSKSQSEPSAASFNRSSLEPGDRESGSDFGGFGHIRGQSFAGESISSTSTARASRMSQMSQMSRFSRVEGDGDFSWKRKRRQLELDSGSFFGGSRRGSIDSGSGEMDSWAMLTGSSRTKVPSETSSVEDMDFTIRPGTRGTSTMSSTTTLVAPSSQPSSAPVTAMTLAPPQSGFPASAGISPAQPYLRDGSIYMELPPGPLINLGNMNAMAGPVAWCSELRRLNAGFAAQLRLVGDLFDVVDWDQFVIEDEDEEWEEISDSEAGDDDESIINGDGGRREGEAKPEKKSPGSGGALPAAKKNVSPDVGLGVRVADGGSNDD